MQNTIISYRRKTRNSPLLKHLGNVTDWAKISFLRSFYVQKSYAGNDVLTFKTKLQNQHEKKKIHPREQRTTSLETA